MKRQILLSLLVATLLFVFTKAGLDSKEEPEFECANKYYRYYLDNEPAEYGIAAGFYEPKKMAYVGIGIWGGATLVGGRIQFDPPGLFSPMTIGPGSFNNNSKEIWYLGRKRHHHYKWIASDNGKDVPFAIEFGSQNGPKTYFGRVKKNETVFLGTVGLDFNEIYYVDENGNSQTSTNYEVLTCKSFRRENPIPLPKINSPSSSPNVDPQNGCISNWQPYNNDDAPSRNGVVAGLHDCGNIVYVGYANPSTVNFPGRIQIVGEKGICMVHKKREFYVNDSSVRYLVDNPNYTYKWIDFDESQPIPQNLVFVSTPNKNFKLPIARVKINGHMNVGYFATSVAYLPTSDGNGDELRSNFELLVCDPWPKYQCAQQWKNLNAKDSNLTVDGFSVDSTSFIGRSIQKCINGCDYGLGKIQAGSNGVNYLDDLTANAVFDNSSNAEYLVKDSTYTYKWQPSRSGVKVVNALELHKEGHRPFYIGMTRINDNVVVGKIRPGEGLFYVDPITGKQQSTSSYEVLTCTSPDASNGEYEEESDADWFGSFGCPVRKQWSFTKWRCVCREEFKGIFAFSGTKWNEETCSYV